MKSFYTKTIFLLALIVVGAGTARAQFSIGLDGIKFDTDSTTISSSASSTEISSLRASAIIWGEKKPNPSLRIGRTSYSTIPMVELGWNVLSGVGYAPYAAQAEPVGNFFDIRNWKSTQLTINLFHVGAYSRASKVGFTMALGVRANNYRFGNSLTLGKQNGMVVPLDLGGQRIKKSKMNIASVHIPAEVMFGNPRRFAFSVGGYVDMVMNSHTKVKHRGGNKDKEHNLPINFIQAGATARFTFSWFSIYATYQPTQLFKSGRGPEAQQWTIGIGL